MRLSPDAVLDAMIDKPLPRALTLLTLSGAVSFGSYEMMRGLDVSAAEHNAGVQACAGMLNDEAAQVRSVDIPGPCDDFRTSFSFRDTTVRVVARNGEGDNHTTHQRIYDLPSAGDFRTAHIETAAEADQQKSADEKTALAFLGLEFGLGFTGMTYLARLRRAGRKRQACEDTGTPST